MEKNVVLMVLLLSSHVLCYPNRPGACSTTPFQSPHSTTIMADNGATVTVSNIGVGYAGGFPYPYTVNIKTTNAMAGFLLFATDKNGNHVGSFNADGNQNQQTLGNVLNSNTCPGGTTLGHNNVLGGVTTMTAAWLPPPVGTGAITFNLFYTPPSGTPYPSYSAQSTLIQEGPPPTATSSVTQVVTQAVTKAATNAATSTPINNNNNLNSNIAQNNGPALSSGAIAGIALGGFFGLLCLAAFIIPIIYARTKKDSIKRLTTRFSRTGKV